MGNRLSCEEDLMYQVIKNARTGAKCVNRLLGYSHRSIVVGPRGECFLVKNALPGIKRLSVFFIMDGQTKHIDDITYEKNGYLFLKADIIVNNCFFSEKISPRNRVLVVMITKST